MPTKKKKTATKKSAGSTAAASSKSKAIKFVMCPYSNQKVFLQRATLKDLKSKETYSSKTRRLWMLNSPSQRQEIYMASAVALAKMEQALLPSFGGRSWEVTCKLSDPGNNVLFRTYKGKMELAVLPHLMDKIPEPPTWPGRRKHSPEEYEDIDSDGACWQLANREMSNLSCLAWDLRTERNHPVPTVTLKWKSPDHCLFYSRKAAWEYAEKMAKREIQINKTLLGIGASGKLLQPSFCSAPTALKVGKLRFERDGLWVVGQELEWQENRPEEIIKQEEQDEIDKINAIKQEEEEFLESIVDEWPTTGLQLYVKENRQRFKDQSVEPITLKQADRQLRRNWRTLSEEEQKEWIEKVKILLQEAEEEEEEEEEEQQRSEQNGENCTDDLTLNDEEEQLKSKKLTPKSFYVQTQLQEHRETRQKESPRITPKEAEEELVQLWETLSEEEQTRWQKKLEEFFSSSKVECVEESPFYAKFDKKLEEESKSTMETTIDMDTTPVDLSFQEEEKKEDDCKDSTEKLDQTEVDTTKSNTETVDIKTESTEVSSQEIEPALNEVVASAVPTVDISVSDPDKIASDDAQPVVTASASKPKPISKAKKIAVSKKKSVPPTLRKWCLDPDQISLCYDACLEHFDQVMRTVKYRDLTRELQDGFDVLRERGRGRFDMELPAFESPVFEFLTSLTEAPWMPIVKTILGDDAVLIHKGCFLSNPGADAQEYHQDGVHLSTQTQRPCHAINVFVPLVDLTARHGPTEFCLGSHILGHDGYDRDFVDTPTPKAGTPVIFDYRLGHRGLGNSSQVCRPIVYCTYARATEGKEFRDSVNFSRKRYHKIGELISKPLSRAERRNNRKRSLQSRLEEEQIRLALEESKQLLKEEMKSKECDDKNVSPLLAEAPVDQSPTDEQNTPSETAPAEQKKQKLHEDAIAIAMQTI